MEFLVYSKTVATLDREKKLKLFGGKAESLMRLESFGIHVPKFIVISADFMDLFLKERNFEQVSAQMTNPAQDSARIHDFFEKEKISTQLMHELQQAINSANLAQCAVAVRSSGADEDSSDHSFAGMFSSFLSQRGYADIELSLRRCWASAYSERALSYRLQNNLSITDIKMGVVIQEMVDPDVSGVMFTRNPIDLLDRDNLIIDSVWGLGEGLVSGELDSDHYVYSREKNEATTQLAEKKFHYVRDEQHSGIIKQSVVENKIKEASLSPEIIEKLSSIGIKIEEHYHFR